MSTILHEKKDCTFKFLEWNQVKDFLDKYHKQKSGKPTNINIGCIIKDTDELIGVCTFAKSRYKNNKLNPDWEWMRLCYKEDIIVKGGTQKFLNLFRENYPGSIISYQFENFKGTMFEPLGFKLIKKSRSNIFINPLTGQTTRHRFINDKRDKKLQEYLKNNPNNTVNDYFGYTEVKKDMICYTWFKEYKPIGYIYKISSPEGKIYVGQKTSEVFDENYWSSSQNPEYWNDLKTFGKENFKREVLEWCYTKNELNCKEVEYIEKLSSMKSQGGYNLVKKFPNIEWTDEVRKHNLESRNLYWSKKENRIKIGNTIKNSKKYQDSRKWVGPLISAGKINSQIKEKTYAFTKTNEFREKCRIKNLNRHWYNNGNIQVFAEHCPDGFISGMLSQNRTHNSFTNEHKKLLSEKRKGKFWWNNGKESTYAFESPGLNWVKGRLLEKNTHKWYNNGKIQIKAKSLPGPDFVEGRLNSFNILLSDDEIRDLYTKNTLTQLAQLWNTTVPTVISFLKKRKIKKKN